MFETAYLSAWHHPGAAWASACLVLAVAARTVARPASPEADARARLAAVLALVSALDAFCSGSLAPPLAATSPWYDRVAVLFVIAGDQRFFYLAARQVHARTAAFLRSLALALVVPAVAFTAQRLAPRLLPDARALFLAYELAFVGVAAGAAAWAQTRIPPGPVRRWVAGLAAFELVQYAGWALADVVILARGDVGFLVRIPPNLLYYAAFVPFAWATAPREART